jgi:hypothetical protein
MAARTCPEAGREYALPDKPRGSIKAGRGKHAGPARESRPAPDHPPGGGRVSDPKIEGAAFYSRTTAG